MSNIEKKIISESNLKLEFEVKIAAEAVSQKKEEELVKLQKTYKIDGFRAGKVPLELIKEKEGTALFLRCGELVLNQTIDEIVQEKGKRLAIQPNVTIKVFEEGKDIEFNLVLEFVPEVPNIDFSSIKLNKYVIEATDKDIEDSIKRITENYKDYIEQGADYVSKMGDRVKINYFGTVDGIPFDGGNADKYDLVLGSNSFIDTFEEQLVGKKAGDKVLVKVKFPDNYHHKALAGKDAEFETEIVSVSIAKEPELNDEFVKDKFSIENVEEFKKVLKNEIEKNYQNISKDRLKGDLFEYLTNNVKFDLPETVVNKEFERLWEHKEKNITEENKEKAKVETRKNAEDSVKLGFIFTKIAEDNEITLEEREVMKELTERALKMPGYEKFLMDFYKKNKQAMDELRASVFEDKVINCIIEKISLTEVKTNMDDFNKLNQNSL